jgi:hypothetical protein
MTLDLISTLAPKGTVDVKGVPHDVFSTSVSFLVPVTNVGDDQLVAAKLAAHEMIYGDVKLALQDLKAKLPKTHHAKVDKVLQKLELVLTQPLN